MDYAAGSCTSQKIFNKNMNVIDKECMEGEQDSQVLKAAQEGKILTPKNYVKSLHTTLTQAMRITD